MSKSPVNGARPGYRVANWHRRIGIAAALIVVWLAGTGLFLNHSDDLNLDSRYFKAAWLLDWYGVSAPNAVAFPAGEHWVLQLGEQLYVDAHRIDRSLGQQHVLGAVQLQGEIYVVTEQQLIATTSNGRVIESLDGTHGVPNGIRAVGIEGNQIAVLTAEGIFVADSALTRWQRSDAPNTQWSTAATPPAQLLERVSNSYRGRLITWERVMLDLHSGRLLGGMAKLVMDIVAVALLVLAGSGLAAWLLRRNSTKTKESP